MWISKFLAHSTQRILDNFGKDSGRTPSICKRIFRQGRLKGHERVIGTLTSERCKSHKDAAARCPKTPWDKLCCKKLFPKTLPTVESKCIGDIYHETYNTIKIEGQSVVDGIKKEIKPIRESLSNLPIEDHHLKDLHDQLTANVMSNMSELLSIQPRCGSIIRKEMLLLNDKAWRAIYALKQDTEPGLRQINFNLDRIQEDVCICVERATLIVKSCRTCTKHDALSECIKKSSDDARIVLEGIKKDTMGKLDEMRKHRDRLIKYHTREADEVTSTYREKLSEFSKYLERCIADVKKKRK